MNYNFIHIIQLRSLYFCKNLLVSIEEVKNLKLSIILICLSLLTFSCQTIKQKTDIIIQKENQKLSKFIGKSSSDLQSNLGKPDEDFRNEKGNLVFVYNTKKYGIPCERRFEIDQNSFVIGFVSNGCF